MGKPTLNAWDDKHVHLSVMQFRIITSSHFGIFSSSHPQNITFTSSHLHIYIYTYHLFTLISSQLHIYTYSFCRLHSFSLSHLHISSSHIIFTPTNIMVSLSHLVIFSSTHIIFSHSHLLALAFSRFHPYTNHVLTVTLSSHTCTSSYLHISSSSHLHIFTSAHLIFTSSHLHTSHTFSFSHVFFYSSLFRPRAAPTRIHNTLRTTWFSMMFNPKIWGKLRFNILRRNPFARNEVQPAKAEVKLRFNSFWRNPFALIEVRSATIEVIFLLNILRHNPFARNEVRLAKSEVELRSWLVCRWQPFCTNWASIGKNWSKIAMFTCRRQAFRTKWV